MAEDEDPNDERFYEAVQRAIFRIRSDPMDEHAQEIGRLSILWSRLELRLTMLLDDLLEIQDRTTLNILLGSLDMRTKVKILMPLAFSKKRSDDWFERLQDELNRIDNELRSERNRMIHDFWTIDERGGPASRMQLAPRVVKDQKTQKLKLANVKPVTAAEITVLTVRVATAIGVMDGLRDEYGGPTTLPQIPPSPSPPANPAQDQNPA